MTDASRHLKTLFSTALERPSGPERAAYLDGACAGETALRAEVEALLAASERAGGFLEPGPAPEVTAERPAAAEAPGKVVGSYKLIEQIGDGGMGTVWMAEQSEPVRRTVAVKLIKPGMDSKAVLARFEAERQALALMEHTNIARVLDAGGAPNGRPFFVMELVKGVPITRFCDQYHLTPRQRLELFVPVCAAIQHAHQKGIIHRDIKPSNVLVALYDDRPVPKVIDFGVAKATGPRLTEKTLHTGFGAVVGTVEYMSPEQASFNQLDVDTRSDVYSLGVLLYELLAGSPPFTREELAKSGLLETLRVIREQEPTKPSTKLSTAESLPTLAVNRGTEPAKLTKLVRGELDWIVMKALEKDRNRRYDTANGLARDVERYLNDEPVQACPPSALYRLRKFARRNRAAVVAVTTVALAVVAAVIGLTVGYVRVTEEKKQKEVALAESEANLLLARQAVDEIYTPVADQLAVLPYMQPYQRDVLEKTLRFYQEFAKRKSSDPGIRLQVARASLRVVSIQLALGQRGEYEKTCRAVIAALDQLAVELPSEPKCRLALGEAHGQLSTLLAGAGRNQEAEQHCRRALACYSRLAEEHPEVPEYRQRLAGTWIGLGGRLWDQPKEAERCYSRAIRLSEQLVAEWPKQPKYRGELVSARSCLGCLLAFTQRPADAEVALRQAIDLYEHAGAELDRTHYRSLRAEAYYQLGRVLALRGSLDQAEAADRRAVALAEKLVAQFPDIPYYRSQLITSYHQLAALLVRRQRPDEAAVLGRSAVELTEKLLTDWLHTCSVDQTISLLFDLGVTLWEAGELQASEKVTRKALELAKQEVADAPTEPRNQTRLAGVQYSLGKLLQKARRYREAAEAYRESLRIREQLAVAFPDDPDYQYERSKSANFLGINLRSVPAEREAALALHRQAIKLCEPLVAKFPDRFTYNLEFVRGHYALGMALITLGRWEEAEAALRAAIAAGVRHSREEGDCHPQRNQMGSVHNDLAWLLATCPDHKFRDSKRAVELARRAVKFSSEAGYWNTLGAAEYRAGNWKEAQTALEKSMALGNGGDGFDWFFLAMVRWQLNDTVEARKWYDKADEWMKKCQPKNEELLRFRAEAAELLKVERTDSK